MRYKVKITSEFVADIRNARNVDDAITFAQMQYDPSKSIIKEFVVLDENNQFVYSDKARRD